MKTDHLTEADLETLLELQPDILKKFTVCLSPELTLWKNGDKNPAGMIELETATYVGSPQPVWFTANKVPKEGKGHKYVRGVLLDDNLTTYLLRLCDICIPEIEFYGGS